MDDLLAGLQSQARDRMNAGKTQPPQKPRDDMDDLLADLERHGLTAPTPHGRRLTPRGFLVSNAVIAAAWEAL